MARCTRSPVLPCFGRQLRPILYALPCLLLLWPPAAHTCPELCSCSSGQVDCVEHRLRFVPEGLPNNATAVLLDYNRITVLQKGALKAQGALRRLSLRANALVSVHRQALAGLGQLEELDLSGNELSFLSPETFLPVPNLRVLDVANNRLLGLQLVGPLPRLEILSTQGNALVSLRPGFFQNLPSLRHLRLEGNPWVCSCGIQALFQWLTENAEKVPEVDSVSCKQPASFAHYPIAALGNDSFAFCWEPWLQPGDYAFFLLIGPSTFLASICLCILAGLVAAARARMTATTYVRPGALARRAERHQH